MQSYALTFDENGLIPCIVQDFYTGTVLTLAYMNRESLDISIAEKRTCFWSRSRKELWRKGETSGHIQHLVSLTLDCDGDALVAKVIKDGPACHTGAESCFYASMFTDESIAAFSLDILYDMIAARKTSPVEKSYTSYLFAKGREKILKKIGEESTEVVIAAMKEDRRETIFEVSDLCYHVLVLMVECSISLSDVLQELASRHVVDHKIKQEPLQ